MEENNTAQPTAKTITPAFDLFKPSLNAIKLNIKTVITVSLVLPVYFMLASILAGTTILVNMGVNDKFSTGGLLVTIVTVLIGLALALIFAPAGIYLQLQSVKGNVVSFSQALTEGRKFVWRYFALSLIVGLTVFCGLLFFIVPGVIFLRRYFLAGYYMLDQNLGVNEAMKASAQQSKQYSGSIYSIIGVYVLLAIASSILGIIPIFGAIAGVLIQFIYSFAPAVRYTEIQTPVAVATTTPPVGTPTPTA